jgi:DNA-binding SARP family transcriptional activator/ABC-type branched-subunit amino acid transport system substrate-binding protein
MEANRSATEFRILGPLEVLDDGRPVDLGGPKQRALLAALLLRANEVVSQDTLIDDLWGESPPATAPKTLQAYVSRLRKALAGANDAVPSARLETQGHGYVLRIAPEALDAHVFQRRLEEGRQALTRDDPKLAADRFRQALALWHGPPLADLAYESFAQPEIARLEELRLTALEERIDADLALGRGGELIGELEALVERHPLRERLRGQLMLALYRAGRQAQALQAYQDGRQHLSAELGLEPGESLRRLERQILEQDPELGASGGRPRPALVPARVWRHPRRVAVAGALVLAVAIGVGAWRLASGEQEHRSAGALVLDADTGDLRETISFGTAPSSVAVGEGSVWVLDGDDKTVTQIDPETNRVRRVFSTSSTPTDIAAGSGAVWVGNAPSRGLSDFPASVSRIDPASGVVVGTVDLPPAPGGHPTGIGGFSRQKLAVTPEAVWAVNPDQTVSRIDPRTNRRVARVEAKAQLIAAGEGDVWIVEDGAIAEIDTARNVVTRRVVLPGYIGGLAVGAGSVWVADPFDGSVWRIARDPPVAKRRIPLATWVNGVAFGAGAAWATNEIADEVYRIDPRTNEARVVARTASPRGVGAGEGAAWVVAASPPSRDADLPSPVCGEVFSGGTKAPRFLLVSDLPLKGDSRPWTQAIVDGIRHALAQRGFEAGGYTVGYQSCDPSTAQAGGPDFFRCASNAKAYARNLSVVGVIGSFNSPCSYPQIPIANEAADGPLAMLSPSNTLQELTENDELYPSGVRNYVRIAGADRLQAIAHTQLAKELGARRLVVLGPRGGDDFRIYARAARTVGRRLGVEVVAVPYDPEAEDFAGVARKVAKTRPGAVVIADILYAESAAVIRSVRAAVGPKTAIVVPDGFGPPYDDLIALAGPAAKGVYGSHFGIPNAELPPRGTEFLRSFASARATGAGPDYAAAYGAQAAEILLDAIARSDGTRASVTREVFRTRVEDGILGDIRFDRNGDPVDAPFTIFRIVGNESAEAPLRPVFDRVVVARSVLLRDSR